MKTLIILGVITFFTILVYPQNPAYLRGKVVYIEENNLEEPQAGITVLIEETGDRDKTDNNGIFKIFLNKKFKPGDKVTLTIEKKDWAIRDPLFGKTHVPSNLQEEIIKLNILPKGSPLFFTDQQIIRYIEYLILKQTTERALSRVDYSKLTLEALLDTMASNWGFGVSEINSTLQIWIEKAIYDTSKFYERGLAEYASKNFDVAGELFKQSANVRIKHFRIIDEDFKKLSQERQTIIKETIKDLRLSGESYFEVKQYDSSLVSYKNTIEFHTYAEDWESLASTLSRVAACYYYLSLKSYDESKFQLLDSANSYLSKGLDLSQNKSLDVWEWNFKGDLGAVNAGKLVFSNISNKSSEISTIIRILEIVEENNLDSKDVFFIRNNIGVCYHMLYEFTEGFNDAKQYLDSANSSYVSILNDSSLNLDYPLEWGTLVNNFVLASIDIGFNKHSIPTYFQMLALQISDLSDISFEDNYSQIIDTTYINSLNEVYAKLLEVEKIINNENNTLELASVLNFIASLRIQLMIYSIDYSTNDFIQITDSIISVTNDLATRDDFFPEKINSIVNKGALDIVKVIHNKIISKDEIIQSNNLIENLLKQGQILKLFETYLKRIMMLNCFLLSNLIDDPSQRNTYHRKASRLNSEVIEYFRELSYYREFEEAIRIQEIINRSN